jgi:hypothetical protein
MWLMILCFAVIALIAMLPVVALVQKKKRVKIRRKQESALKSVERGICERLHIACPGSKWRWVCRPVSFAENGGIARIEVIRSVGNQQFIDVCLSANGFMVLHVLNAVELKASDMGVNSDNVENYSTSPKISASAISQYSGAKPNDEESVAKWYNIVFIDALIALIDDINASGEVCLYIGRDGKAFTEENGNPAIVSDFGEMPDMSLWTHITERLGEAGLFAEVQNENRIFISWA